MGNTVPQRKCHEVAGTGGNCTKNIAEVSTLAAPTSVAFMAGKQRNDEERKDEVTRAGRRRAGVSWAGSGDSAPAATVVRVKIVMKRKDAEALVARLNEQNARGRKARMAVLKSELRAGCDGGCASPSSCRGALRPRLAPIQES